MTAEDRELLAALLVVTFVPVRVLAVLVDTFVLFVTFVPLVVFTVDRLPFALLLAALSLVVVTREVVFVPVVAREVVAVDRVTVPSLNEVLRPVSPLLLLAAALLLSTDVTLLCDEVGRVPTDLLLA